MHNHFWIILKWIIIDRFLMKILVTYPTRDELQRIVDRTIQTEEVQVSPVVDPASGTIEVQARLIGGPGDLRPGMTATVKVSTR